MSALWTSEDAALATGGEVSAAWEAAGVSIDTRTLAPRDLFIALKGDKHDGHRFITEAYRKGAAACVSERSLAEPSLKVQDSYDALVHLARHARKRSEAYVVAVTGSVGKTSTVAGLAEALGRAAVHAPEGSYNNRYGVPLTLARMPRGARFAVFEIGMNHAEEIRPLSRLVAPDLAIITAIAPVHLEFFDSLRGIAEAKAEIFDGLKEGGSVIVNGESEFHDLLRDSAARKGAGAIVSFGGDEASDARLISCETEGEGALVKASLFGEEIAYRLSRLGRAHALNSLAILAAVRLMGEDAAAAAKKLAATQPLIGRGRKHRLRLGGKSLTVIDESYSANPASMKAAFESLALETGEGRRIAVLGDMAELGETAPFLHEALLPLLKEAKAARLFCCGRLMKSLFDKAPPSLRASWGESASSLLPPLLDSLQDGDIVIVKGSNMMGMAGIVKTLISAGKEDAA